MKVPNFIVTFFSRVAALPFGGAGRGAFFLSLALALVSCGTDSDHFSLEGRLLNLNQGEFYVYSTDGLIDAIDTIHVRAGRFTYEIACENPGTLVIVFPNFSEQPVFAEPGASVNLEGNAHNLKEMKIKGTDDNKLMNSFREKTVNASPPEIRHLVELFVGDHPESLVSIYLVRHYFIVCQNPDYVTAAKLFDKMEKAQPDNGRLKQLATLIKAQSKSGVGATLPPFVVKDLNGKTLTQKDFSHGTCLIYVWASWEYESQNIQRFINGLPEGKVKALGISADGSVKDCKKIIEREEIKNSIACDGQMFDGKALTTLGMNIIPGNILVQNGKIIARDLTYQELRDRLNK